MITIENEQLKISVLAKGAELNSIYHKKNALEYLWSGDPAFWGKKSPVLFPIVGTLKEDTYYYNDKPYTLTRHGFARDMEFAITSEAAGMVVFTLQHTEETLVKYPFPFRFDVVYRVQGNTLETTYKVQNTGNDLLYFSVGGHPAFRLPITGDTSYSDYELVFNEKENTGRWPISKDGLIELFSLPLLDHTHHLPLKKELFYKDAIVFKDLQSSTVKLRSAKTMHGLEFDFTGFPYLGIWAAKDADFICIEPWCGIADSVDSNQQLDQKEGIHSLQAGAVFERSWSLSVY